MTAYTIGDLDTYASYFAEDVVFAIYINEDIFPFAGEWKGRERLRQLLDTITAQFVLETYTPRNITERDGVVRCQAAYLYRHQPSGETIDGIERIVAEVNGGRITRYREYHDVERLRAFMRLCNQQAHQPETAANAISPAAEPAR